MGKPSWPPTCCRAVRRTTRWPWTQDSHLFAAGQHGERHDGLRYGLAVCLQLGSAESGVMALGTGWPLACPRGRCTTHAAGAEEASNGAPLHALRAGQLRNWPRPVASLPLCWQRAPERRPGTAALLRATTEEL